MLLLVWLPASFPAQRSPALTHLQRHFLDTSSVADFLSFNVTSLFCILGREGQPTPPNTHRQCEIPWQNMQLNIIKKWSPCIIWFCYCHMDRSVFWNGRHTHTNIWQPIDAVTWFGVMKYIRPFLASNLHTQNICQRTAKQSTQKIYSLQQT